MASSSFQNKRKAKSLDIKGTKAVISNNLLLVSSGIPTLDALLGGGIAVGSIVLIEEDVGRVYSDFLLKCFLAEGAISEHELLICSLDSCGKDIIKDLPGLSSTGNLLQKSSSSNTDDLKIAWRYKNMECQTENSLQFGHCFDMSKKLEGEILQRTKAAVFDAKTLSDACPGSEMRASTPFQEVLKNVDHHISTGGFSTKSDKKHDCILRLGINSIGSPQWNYSSNDSEFSSLMFRFLASLKHLIRTSFSVAFLTVPSHLFQDYSTVCRIANLCDAAFRLESFAATRLEHDDVWREYGGMFHVVKLPRLNSLCGNSDGDNSDLAFKMKRRRFVVEKVHLPPLYVDDKDAKSPAIENSKTISNNNSCTSKSLDF